MGPITFPDAAALVINHLRTVAPTITFAHDVPNPRPDVFVRVWRTGGPKSTKVTDAAQLSIESWAPDVDVAIANASTVRGYLNDLPGRTLAGVPIYRVDELAGPGELPDPLSATRRVTWTVSVHVRGS